MGALEYNVVEITTIKELGKEFERIKTDVQKETEFLENAKTHPVPVGIENLDQEDCDISSVTQKILYDKLYLKDSTPLSTIERTISDYSGLSNEQLYNFSHFERQLTEDDLHCVVEILNSQDDAKDVYIVLTPELKNKDVLKTYSMSKDVATAEMVHVIVNVNLSKGMVNFEEKNGHWTYVAILNDKEIIYGDPLGSRSIPKNLVEVLNPIFSARYGRDIMRNKSETMVNLRNLSNNINFPLQTDGTICGLISAMLCICSFSRDLYREIMFGKNENCSLEFIKNPSKYTEQIRMRFLKVVQSGKHCVELFIPAQIEISKETRIARISKTSASNAWKSLISKPRTSTITSSKVQFSRSAPMPTNTPEHSSTDSAGVQQDASVGKSSDPISADPISMFDERSRKAKQIGPKLVQLNFVGLRSFNTGIGFPNNDGYSWEMMPAKKSKGAKKFKCALVNCTTIKHVFKTKIELRKKISKKDRTCLINVNYIARHSCKEEPKAENVATISYWLNNKGNSTQKEIAKDDGQIVVEEVIKEVMYEAETVADKSTSDKNRDDEETRKEAVIDVETDNGVDNFNSNGQEVLDKENTETEATTGTDSTVSLTEQIYVEAAEHNALDGIDWDRLFLVPVRFSPSLVGFCTRVRFPFPLLWF